MLEKDELKYIRDCSRKTRRFAVALTNSLNHMDLLLQHVAELEADRDEHKAARERLAEAAEDANKLINQLFTERDKLKAQLEDDLACRKCGGKCYVTHTCPSCGNEH